MARKRAKAPGSDDKLIGCADVDPAAAVALASDHGSGACRDIKLLSLEVMGEYVGRIYDDVRHRPTYIVESRHGIGRD